MAWKLIPFHKDAERFAKDLEVDALIAHLLLSRGIDSHRMAQDFFSPEYETHLHDPFLFRDLDKIVERVEQAIHDRKVVGVFGDYDADGVTGSAVLREALEGLGLQVVVHIPDKHNEGHGLSEKGIEVFQDEGVKLFFTVDCGITNREEIALANARGMECIVIDHHHVPEVMPDAVAIVNPKVPNCGYPFADLCGAGTAFKVAQGLYTKLAPELVDQLKWLLDAVAIGTVADCMPIVGENRTLVRYGCVVLAKTRRPGLRELYATGRIPISDERHPDAMTIAFQIAPRINAAGRMAHARVAHDLLVEKNGVEAVRLAELLEGHNNDRRKQSAKVTDEVCTRIEQECTEYKTVVLRDESYPLGIVGLIAGKVAEKYSKPAVILAQGAGMSQGSLRSARGIHLVKILEQCEDLLVKFGGHEQAAGLTVLDEHFEEFRNRFEALVDEALQKQGKQEKRHTIDAELLARHVNSEFMRHLKRFEPFGLGNPEPTFLLREAVVAESRVLGSGNKHLKLKLRVGEKAEAVLLDAIGFGMGEKFFEIAIGDRIDVVGKFQENIWNGRVSLQLAMEEVRKNDEG